MLTVCTFCPFFATLVLCVCVLSVCVTRFTFVCLSLLLLCQFVNVNVMTKHKASHFALLTCYFLFKLQSCVPSSIYGSFSLGHKLLMRIVHVNNSFYSCLFFRANNVSHKKWKDKKVCVNFVAKCLSQRKEKKIIFPFRLSHAKNVLTNFHPSTHSHEARWMDKFFKFLILHLKHFGCHSFKLPFGSSLPPFTFWHFVALSHLTLFKAQFYKGSTGASVINEVKCFFQKTQWLGVHANCPILH